MPGVKEEPKNYFLEKDRKSSFKSWPFTERHACSIIKVCFLRKILDLFLLKPV